MNFMRRKAVQFLFFGSIFLIGFAILLYGSLKYFFPLQKIQTAIENKITDYLGLKTTAQSIQLEWFPAPSFCVSNIKIEESSGTTVVEIPSLRLVVIPILYPEKRLIVAQSIFKAPRIHLIRRKDGNFNIDGFLKTLKERKKNGKKTQKSFLRFKIVSIENGIAKVSDENANGDHIASVNGRLEFLEGNGEMSFDVHGHDMNADSSGLYELKGLMSTEGKIEGKIEDVNLSILKPYLKWIIPVDGKINGKINGFKSAGGQWQWSLTASCKNFSLSDPNYSVWGNCGVTYDEHKGWAVEMTGENKKCSAHVLYWIKEKGKNRFAFNSKKFDMDEMNSWINLYKKKIPQEKDEKESKGEIRCQGRVTVSDGKIGLFLFQNFKSELIINGFNWTFSSSSCKAFDGYFQGHWNMKLKDPKFIEAKWTGTDINTEKFFSIFNSSSVSGRMHVTGTYNGDIGTFVKSKGEGSLKFEIDQGSIRHLPIFLKILSVVNFKTILDKILGRGKVENFPFQSITGTLHLKNGMVKISTVDMESETLAIKAKGTVDIIKERINARVSVQALSFIDEIVRAVPILNRLYQNKKSLIPLNVNVDGPLKNPVIQAADLPKTAGKRQ